MIFAVIAVAIMAAALINYKKAFMLYLACQIFFLSSANLITIGSKSATVSMCVNLFFFLLYEIHYRKNSTKTPFPYCSPFILIIISAFFTCFVSLAGFSSEFTRAISNIIQELMLIWLIWKIVETREDFRKLFEYITIVMFIACIYGFAEYILQNNVLLNYKSSLLDGGISMYSADFARGYRLCSFFEHPIGAGMCFSLYSLTVFTIYIRYKENLPRKYLSLLTALLCIPCALLTKMRASLLFFLIGALIFVDFKNRRFMKFVILGGIIGLFAIPFLGENLEIFLSLFNINKLVKYSSSGSSLVQRLTQFDAVYHLMMLSPIGGLGELFKQNIVNEYTKAALSYESIWLEQMAKHGVFGVLANMLLMIYVLLIIPKRYKSKECFFLGLAYWIVYTLTSIPSFRIPLYYLLMFYFIKRSETYTIKRNKKDTKLA